MEKQPMSVSVDRSNADAVVVRITGEIGMTALLGPGGQHTGIAGDNALDDALVDVVPAGTKCVVVDLTGASFLSSMGIGTLVRFRNQQAEKGCAVRLAAGPQMITLLKLGRLDQLLPVFPTVVAAVKA
jgi:anti-anti-sigma factor